MEDTSFQHDNDYLPEGDDIIGVTVVSGSKAYYCKFPSCEKTFKFKSEISRHLTTHSNTRPYVCPFDGCEKSFKRSDALDNHKRIHTKETPYICPYEECQKMFTTKASLRYHLLKHKDERTFKCSFPGCKKSFITLFQLRQHEKSTTYHNKLMNNTEQNMYINSTPDSYERTMISYSEPPAQHFEQPEKQPFVPTCCYEEPPTIYFNTSNQVNVTSVMKENEILKKRLEMSEKLLFKLMNQQTMGGDSFYPMMPFQDFMAYPQSKQEPVYPTLE